jgi:GTP-binding protein of the ras superfamily involved in termination of M-phase
VNFMEKTIALCNTDITFSIWDLGGQQEYLHMLPLVCNDAVALLFMFDLSRKSTLTSVKNWYKQARLLNKTATPFLIGTKYDYFSTLKMEEKREMTNQARRFAKAMKAPLLFCSASHAINIHKIFKVVLAKVFDLKCTVAQILEVGDPIIEYEQSATATDGDGGEGGADGTGGAAAGGAAAAGGDDETGAGSSAAAAASGGGGHRRDQSTASSDGGETLAPVVGRHQANASIGSSVE